MKKEGFDHHWDIKDANGHNVTENKLYKAMKDIGLNPKREYQISEMRVDFAFPDEMVVIEVNGPHHNAPEQRARDKKRWFVLNNEGWKVKTFTSNRVYYHADDVADEVKQLLEKGYIENPHYKTKTGVEIEPKQDREDYNSFTWDEVRQFNRSDFRRFLDFLLEYYLAIFILGSIMLPVRLGLWITKNKFIWLVSVELTRGIPMATFELYGFLFLLFFDIFFYLSIVIILYWFVSLFIEID